MKLFNHTYKQIFILCPFWRCGSTLLSAVLSTHNKIENLDEIFEQDHPWNHIDWKNFTGSHHIYSWQNSTEYQKVYDEYINNLTIDNNYQQKFKIDQTIDQRFLKSSNYVMKIHGEQCHAFSKIIPDDRLQPLAHNSKSAFVLLYRKNINASILSMILGMENGRFHAVTDNKNNFLSCHKSQTTQVNCLNNSQKTYLDKIKIIKKYLLPFQLSSINAQIKRLKQSGIQFVDELIYENFKIYDYLADHFHPYQKSQSYIDLESSLPDQQLVFSNNRFVIESF